MRSSRRERYYTEFPEPVEGYELNPEQGLISVIIPEATTNLVTNPSVESGVTTGYAAFTGAMAATYNWQAYGAAGLQLTPAVSSESGFYFGTIALAAGSTYTASITIQGEAGKLYYIWFASTAGALIGSKRSWRGTGHKQRIHVTTVEPTGASRRVYVTRDGQYSDQNLWYADGLQVEAKSYPTTYCDGDQKGFLVNEFPLPYLWNGTPRASTSSRSAQTRTGGREMNLANFGFHLLTIIGLGMASLVDQSLPLPGRGELAQGTGTQAREFSLVGELISDGPRHLSAMLDDLEGAFKPDLVVKDQPLILRYQAYDEDEPCGDSLDIICKYRGGLEGAVTNHLGERLALNFKQYLPFLQSTYDSGIELGYQDTIANANRILKRGTDGVWSAMATGANQNVFAWAQALDGSMFLGGDFTDLGGANGDSIASWNGSAFAALGLGLHTGGGVNALAVGPDGSLYAGGSFEQTGVATLNRVGKWDGANWSALGSGIDAGGEEVRALVVGPDGYLYVGGIFADAGGVAANNIARWDGANWQALGSGITGTPGGTSVEALAFAKNGDLYAAGAFTNAGGTAVANIAKWNGASWSAPGYIGGTVYALAIAPNGDVYAGGSFTYTGDPLSVPPPPTINSIARWNGSEWFPLGVGVNNIVRTMTFSPDGLLLYVGGDFTRAGGYLLPDRAAIYNGTAWIPLDIDFPATSAVYSMKFDSTGNLYVGFSGTGSATSATVKTPNAGSMVTYPVFHFTGPGAFYQLKNYTNGKLIIPNLSLLAGETAVLDLNPGRISFISSFRGSIIDTLLKGSMLNFELMPGVNNISAYAFGGTTAATKVFMTWKQQYWSQEGAVWK